MFCATQTLDFWFFSKFLSQYLQHKFAFCEFFKIHRNRVIYLLSFFRVSLTQISPPMCHFKMQFNAISQKELRNIYVIEQCFVIKLSQLSFFPCFSLGLAEFYTGLIVNERWILFFTDIIFVSACFPIFFLIVL